MSKTTEIELRYEILDQQQLSHFLKDAELLHTKHDIDTYLDTPERILWKKGIFVRIRNNKTLDIKFNRACLQDASIDRLDYCEEHRFTLPLKETDLTKLNPLLISLNLKPLHSTDLNILKSTNNLDTHYIVDKVRSSYRYQSFTIAIDIVANLGTFLEIELMAENAKNLEQVKSDMRLALAGLKLQPLHFGYGAMLLQKHQPECYAQGRYALKENQHRAKI